VKEQFFSLRFLPSDRVSEEGHEAKKRYVEKGFVHEAGSDRRAGHGSNSAGDEAEEGVLIKTIFKIQYSRFNIKKI
jgi:hypothetical protein